MIIKTKIMLAHAFFRKYLNILVTLLKYNILEIIWYKSNLRIITFSSNLYQKGIKLILLLVKDN